MSINPKYANRPLERERHTLFEIEKYLTHLQNSDEASSQYMNCEYRKAFISKLESTRDTLVKIIENAPNASDSEEETE